MTSVKLWSLHPGLGAWLFVSAFAFFVTSFVVWRGRAEWDAYTKSRREARATAEYMAELQGTAHSLLSHVPTEAKHGVVACNRWWDAVQSTVRKIEFLANESSDLPSDVAGRILNPTERPTYEGKRLPGRGDLTENRKSLFTLAIACEGLEEARAMFCDREGVRP